MVLYTNDAVEVRYSDGSRLHVLPCGTAFSFHWPQDGAHPANGMEMIQQRCRFVTSTYRDLVLSAVDFRNRFAERPYVCEELMEKDQAVSLYARIDEIAWPKEVTLDNLELLDDGSVCVTSEDQFGSLILSAHRRDFTVCYLSQLSTEKPRCRHTYKTKCKTLDKNHGEKRPVKITDKVSMKLEKVQVSKPVSQPVFSNMPDVVPVNRAAVNVDSSPDRFGSANSLGNNVLKKSLEAQSRDELNISPITQASCADSPQALSNASGSPLTPHDAVKDNDAKFRPFSTPTEELEGSESPYGNTAVFKDYVKAKTQSSVRFAQTENFDGSYIGENIAKETNCNENGLRDGRNVAESRGIINANNDHNVETYRVSSTLDGQHTDSQLAVSSAKENLEMGRTVCDDRIVVYNDSDTVLSQGSGDSLLSRSGGDGESDTRYKYMWLTRHISVEEAPNNLAAIVKLAQDLAEHGGTVAKKLTESTGIQPKDRKATDVSKLRQIDKNKCRMAKVPLPLPLSCPGQHLHKMQTKRAYDDGKDPIEDPTTFSQGRLKVLLVDGIVYRIVRHPTMKLVEIYPGDGSVLVSQGVSAYFFVHVIPHGNKLEERTYSVKSPPPIVKGKYSIKSLLNRAHRFLNHVRQEENAIPASVGLYCWKHEEPMLIEPEATTVLEESEIPGYGKFTALSNGQVRIAFSDRTCLDMTYDFTARLQRCTDTDSEKKSVKMLADKTAGTCRLLLPNGQYQMVDLQAPGQYKRYIDIAKEWAAWVNSSPVQRQNFYKQTDGANIQASVARELQKIQCFNYIVDSTVFKKPESGSSCYPGAFKPYNPDQKKPGPSILRNPDGGRDKTKVQVYDGTQRAVTVHPPESSSFKSSSLMSSVTSYDRNLGVQRQTVSNTWGRSKCPAQLSMDTSTSSMLMGFNSVREALLRTSSVINDIDQLLEKK